MALTAKAPKHKGLTVKQIDARTWQVECTSKQHGFFHTVVKSLTSGRLICDSACHAFRRSERCPHTLEVAILLNGGRPIVARTAFELFSGDEIEPEQPTPDISTAVGGEPVFLDLRDRRAKPKPQLEDLWRDA